MMILLRSVQLFFGALFFADSVGTGNCLVLLQGTASLKLPYDFPVGVTFYRVHVLDETHGKPPEGLLNFHILKSATFPNESNAGRGLFMIDEHTGSLMLSPHRRHSIAEFKDSMFALDLAVVLSNQPSEDAAHATIVITITEDNFTMPYCQPREELCFSSAEIQYQVPETAPSGTFLGSLRPIPYSKLCKEVETKYQILSDDYLSASLDGENLKTGRSFDFEEEAYREWNVSCEVKTENGFATFIARLRVLVLDVDDNPPFVQNSTSTYHRIHVSQIVPGKPLPLQFLVLDKDSSAVNKITVSLIDPLKLFDLRDPVIFHRVNDAFMIITTALVPKVYFHLPDSTYNVSVIFNDTSLVNNQQAGQVVFYIHITNTSTGISSPLNTAKEFQIVGSVFRHSSHHARVVQPMKVLPHEGYFFRLSRNNTKGLPRSPIFGVTPVTGIVFVMDEVALARSTSTLFHLELTWRSKDVMDRRCAIIVRVLDAGVPSNECGVEPGHQFPSCALHGSAEKCSTSCGRGASGGFCLWRSQSFNNLAREYATCSPNLKTCPDGICDELEEMDRLLCPQDCAGYVHGEAVASISGRGVAQSAAPCICPTPNRCLCLRPQLIPDKIHRPSSRSQVKDSKDVLIKSQPLELQENWGGCGTQCMTMIVVVSLIVSGLVSLAGFLLYRRWVARSKSSDFPTVTAPLNVSAVPGDIGEQEDLQIQNISVDAKLEFPRDQLLLEDILGEGEFAKVVKGRAYNISNIHGTTTVAVKMLKDGNSSSERRDLISELNLLKEISHPNVIHLLGACTGEGPLYVIMEYAEHGSLITYLRKMKVEGSDIKVNLSKLLSFARQIAKGMEYLANMKVVHRDLAARNVLVAAGEILKISDFGLSRDVYEGDTYLKTTKGKVPIKWMALESLENQFYTTKSDVWSYGIVLWEIITVGGCPYPGIPVERVFELLKDGYRMPRPDSCPPNLYQIMIICWLANPKERPHFKELVQKIESIQKEFTINSSTRVENHQHQSKKFRNREEESVLQQLTSFPKLSVQRVGPYENQCLLSPSEFSV